MNLIIPNLVHVHLVNLVHVQLVNLVRVQLVTLVHAHCSGFSLLILSWLPIALPTISLAPEGYSCCPIVTVEVGTTAKNFFEITSLVISASTLIFPQHAHGDFYELNGIYLLVVEKVKNTNEQCKMQNHSNSHHNPQSSGGQA